MPPFARSPMLPYLEHESTCRVCRRNWQLPCSQGAVLLKDGAMRLTKQLAHNPGRARA